ncbi:ribosome silencing factor [Paludisphaera sp.]|uniref:ribosome silencing factor n=1 Tax=Paludisphaera sp. TaxID=2017432 RepID=UPI00301B7879
MPDNDTTTVPPPEPSTPTARTRAIKARSIREAQDEVVSEAGERRNPERLGKALEHARLVARIADENRAKDILLLDLRKVTPLLDYFVIATAGSRRQANAIASDVDAEMKKRGEHKLGMEGVEEGRWILIDYGDFVVHVFSGEGRSYYALEEIWGDAPQIPWRDESTPVAAAEAPADEAPADDAPSDEAPAAEPSA